MGFFLLTNVIKTLITKFIHTQSIKPIVPSAGYWGDSARRAKMRDLVGSLVVDIFSHSMFLASSNGFIPVPVIITANLKRPKIKSPLNVSFPFWVQAVKMPHSGKHLCFPPTCGCLNPWSLCHYMMVYCGPWGTGLFPRESFLYHDPFGVSPSGCLLKTECFLLRQLILPISKICW